MKLKELTKCKTYQRERKRDLARDGRRADRRENRVTVHTPTRRQTRHVRRDNRCDNGVALVCFGNDRIVCFRKRREKTAIALVCFSLKAYLSVRGRIYCKGHGVGRL